MMRCFGRRRGLAAHGGQALAEFLALTVALVPLFLLLPMIGKYQDLAHATQMASRYAAFDATSFGNAEGYNRWKPPAQLANEIRRRFYSNADAPIKTGDVAGDFDANRNVFWRDPYGRPLIKDFTRVAVSFGNGGATQAAGFSGASDGVPFNQVPMANADAIGLEARGVYTANASVGLVNLPSGIRSVMPFDAIDLTVRRHTSLLFDDWSAPVTMKTEERVGRLAPVGTGLSVVSPLVKLAVQVLDRGEVASPEYGSLRAWRDVVPADRLIAQ